MQRAFAVVAMVCIVVGCTANEGGTPSIDAAAPGVDAAHDATFIDGSTLQEDAAIDDASDASIATDTSIAIDAADTSTPFDAATFPDAANLAGLHITFLGNTGAYPQSSLDAFLASSATVARIHTSAAPGTALVAGDLAGIDIVILDALARVYTTDEAQVIATWVAAGGGLFSMTGYTGGSSDTLRPNSILASFGIQYGAFFGSSYDVPPLIAHPTMTNVAHIRFFGGFSVLVPGLDAGTDAGVDTIVAMLDATNIALVANQYGTGRVLVWGDEWVEYDSEFSTNPSNQRFWDNSIAWLARR